MKIIDANPFQDPPPYEKLRGSLDGCYSCRINVKHRLVYQVREEINEIVVIALWSHYESL